MKLSSPLRLVLGSLIVTIAVALVWWLVGFQIGKAMLAGNDAATFKKAFGVDDPAFLRLAFLAVAGAIAVATAGKNWLPLAGVAFGAAVLFPDKGAGATLAVVLFVLCSAGVAEMGGGVRSLIAAAAAALVISLAFTLEGSYGRSELAVVSVIRAVFYFLPLLALPEWVEKLALKRVGAK